MNVCTIGSRLREERERLGLSQPALGEIAGAAKRTVIDWEKGKSSPNGTQLAALTAAGLDVLYILTGQRAGNAPAPPALTPEQRALLANYEACTPLDRAFIRKTAAMASQFHQVTGGRKKAKGGKK